MALSTCLQNPAKASSIVAGLRWSALGVRLRLSASKRVGVGCGCQPSSVPFDSNL
jgi:hypothetical protein